LRRFPGIFTKTEFLRATARGRGRWGQIREPDVEKERLRETEAEGEDDRE